MGEIVNFHFHFLEFHILALNGDGGQGDAIRKLTCFLDLLLVACEADPSVAEHLLGHSVRFFRGAMKHGNDALLLTFVQQLFQGGDGGAKLGICGG